MKETNKSSRRTFLGKITAGTIALTVTPGWAQNSFPSVFDITAIQPKSTAAMKNDEKKFVPVMITPFHSNSKIDFDGLSRLIDFYMAADVKGFFANCLSSEMYNLDNEERLALVSHVVKRVKGAVPVVATGSFGNSIEERAEFTKKMYNTGVNAVILITSHFANADEDDAILIKNLEKFFSLTDAIPLGTYECPSPYKRIITPEVFRYLLSTNRLGYHKDTTIDLDKIKVKLEMSNSSSLEFYDAHTPNAMYSLQAGAKGISCLAGNFYPEIFAWLCTNVNNLNRQKDVNWLQSELTRVDSIISDNYPLSSKYFLHKRGVPINIISRTTNASLTSTQIKTLDETYKVLLGWHERLGIKVAH